MHPCRGRFLGMVPWDLSSGSSTFEDNFTVKPMKSKKNKYLKEYEWANIRAMLRNNKKAPKECTLAFHGKLVVISGTTSGIGYKTARTYAAHGADLICINRNEKKSLAVCTEIRKEFSVSCESLRADYTSLSDIISAAHELSHLDRDIDVLIHNAGIYSTKKSFTPDDIETVFQVNYVASFLLTYLLQAKFHSQGHGRILYVNSEGHRFAISGLHLDDLRWDHHRFSGTKSYGVAKTAQLLSLIKFAPIFAEYGVTINALHPGDVKTNMGENNGWLYRLWKHLFIAPSSKSPQISATALYYLGVSPEVEGISGKFFNLTTEEEPAPPALDADMAEALWTETLNLVNVDPTLRDPQQSAIHDPLDKGSE